MIPRPDDGIVVVAMSHVHAESDERKALREELVARLDDLSTHCRQEIAWWQAERARYERPIGSGQSTVRETPPSGGAGGHDSRLDRMERRLELIAGDLVSMRRDITDIRDRMATKVELEAVKDSVQKMADGYNDTRERLDRVADLLKRYLTTAE